MRYILRDETRKIEKEIRSVEVITRVAYSLEISRDDAERMIEQATKDEPLLLYSGEEVWMEE